MKWGYRSGLMTKIVSESTWTYAELMEMPTELLKTIANYE